MSDHTALVERYLAAWNETDHAARRALLARVFSPDATYVDPVMRGDGHDGIDVLIAGVHARFPGFRFALARPVESQPGYARFAWRLGPADAPAVIEGSDFARLDDDGRIAAVWGFIDRLPDDAVAA